MALALECPERLIRIRAKDLTIGDSCEWQGIRITRQSQRQYVVTGYGRCMKIGKGKMRIENICDQIVTVLLAWQQWVAMWAARAAEIEARRKHRRASVPPAQLPLWGLV